MKTVGIITFHAAHNYGATLQAYALQETIKQFGFKCELINLRTSIQKEAYSLFENNSSALKIVKNLYTLCMYGCLSRKYRKFEDFIENKLEKSSMEYASLKEIEDKLPQYDYYISGSDQIWNLDMLDFDISYFLPFVKDGKRIAYAPSCGQCSSLVHNAEIKKYINQYDYLSVRDLASKNIVSHLTEKKIDIMPDPTLVLDKEYWEQITPKNCIKGEYMFFYTFNPSKKNIQMVKRIAKETKLKVIIPKRYYYSKFSHFKTKADMGPLDFLGLIKHAKLVCTSSFHGTVFSILFHKPFLALNGMADNRICSLLTTTKLTERSVNEDDIDEKIKILYDIDFRNADAAIHRERYRAIDYLKNALEDDDKRNKRNGKNYID